MDLLTFVLLAAIFVPLVVLMERTHRRTSHLPRAPFGVDHESYEWDVFREISHDLDSLRDAQDAQRPESLLSRQRR